MVPRQLKKLHTQWLCLATALPGLGLLGGNVRGRQQSQSHGSSEKQPLVGPRKEGSLNTHCTPAGESVNSGFTPRARGELLSSLSSSWEAGTQYRAANSQAKKQRVWVSLPG